MLDFDTVTVVAHFSHPCEHLPNPFDESDHATGIHKYKLEFSILQFQASFMRALDM